MAPTSVSATHTPEAPVRVAKHALGAGSCALLRGAPPAASRGVTVAPTAAGKFRNELLANKLEYADGWVSTAGA